MSLETLYGAEPLRHKDPIETCPLCVRKQMGRSVPVSDEPNRVTEKVAEKMRTFSTGATRDSDDGKLDYEGFLSPTVLQRYAEYMHKNRIQSDGNVRDSDNWQKGMPITQYMKSLWRHFMDVWMEHRSDYDGGSRLDVLEEALCGVLFNAMGMLHEILKRRE